MKKLLNATLTIFILLGLVACGGSNTPEKTTEAFFQYIAKKDFDKAIDLIYLGDLKDSEMTAAKGKLTMMLSAAYDKMERSGGFKSIKVTETKLSNDGKNATVKYTLVTNKGENNTSMQLINVDGKWKVLMK